MNLWKVYRKHQRLLILPFESIFSDWVLLEDVLNRKYRKQYLFPLLISTIIIIDTGIQYYQHGADLDYRLFHHLAMVFMPQLLIRQSNVLFAALYVLTFLTNFFLYFENYPHGDFILLKHKKALMYPHRKYEFKFVEPKMATKLEKFYEKFQIKAKGIVRLMSFEVHNGFIIPTIFYTLYQLYESSFQNLPTLRFIGLNVLSPLYFDSFVFAIHVGIRFIGQNGMIQVKQKHYCSKMDRKRKSNPGKEYFRWRTTMGNILDITREITHYNGFYSKYLTNLIVVFVFTSCSVFNTVMNSAGKAPIMFLSVWAFYAALYGGCLLLFNAASSKTILLNMTLFKKLRQLQIRLLSKRNLNLSQIVKLDLVNEYKLLLQKCSFRLLNSSMINNKLFAFQIFGCLGVFWMKLASKTESWI